MAVPPIFPSTQRPATAPSTFVSGEPHDQRIGHTSPSHSTSSDWDAKSAAQKRLHDELQPRNKTALFEALAVAGITHVVVSFDGYGDSGQIESVEVKARDAIVDMPDAQIEIARAPWGEAEPERSAVAIADAIEHFVYDLLMDTHDGWANNDGAYGTFTFNVAARKITLDYNERYIETEYTQHEF